MLPFTTAKSGTVTTSVTTIAPTTAALLDDGVTLRTESIIVLATRPDSAKTSPCAKLMSCRIP
jgi:hypothetical protein